MIADTAMLFLYVETALYQVASQKRILNAAGTPQCAHQSSLTDRNLVLHAGTGSGLSSIDLPIQRERATQYPMIQGSSIKGKLRATAYQATKQQSSNWTKDDVITIFGPENNRAEHTGALITGDARILNNGAEHAGALIAGDARILLFPVRSLNGVFAYTTSVDVLNRFARDLGRGTEQLPSIPPEPPEGTALVTPSSEIASEKTLVLEEFHFQADDTNKQVQNIANWIAEHAFPQPDTKDGSKNDIYKYWRDKITTSLIILPKDNFRDFVVNATEVITRIRIDPDKKTVAGGALWTEEHLPSDTVLYVPLYATDARKSKNGSNGSNGQHEPALTATQILSKVQALATDQNNSYMQLGGDETVGRGMVRLHIDRKDQQ